MLEVLGRLNDSLETGEAVRVFFKIEGQEITSVIHVDEESPPEDLDADKDSVILASPFRGRPGR